VVVVGASLAGVSAVAELRARGFDGAITLVGAEPHRPYTRPPLSKEALQNGIHRTSLELRGSEWYVDNDVTLRLGVAAVGLDTTRRIVLLADGTTVDYDGLVLATGLEHAPAPLLERLPHAHRLRTVDDAEQLAASLDVTGHLVVVGAGFIGLEVAATARSRGLDVTVVDVAPLPMGRAFGPAVGEWFRRRHERAGVRLLTSTIVEHAEETDARSVLRLGTGETLGADSVLVCTGSVPAVAWLAGSGVSLGDGVRCTPSLATSVPAVVAAGDIVRWTNPQFDESMRVVHWTNAVDQGGHAACTLLGDTAPFTSVPYFWTDQYDARLRCIGRPHSDDDVSVLTCDERRLVVVFGRGGRLSGAVCVNAARELARLRQALDDGIPFAEVAAAVPAPAR
jgi:NADPH-dependent 2,4-dienoyl-CoA reductase/sulfur reductase-like enzyme